MTTTLDPKSYTARLGSLLMIVAEGTREQVASALEELRTMAIMADEYNRKVVLLSKVIEARRTLKVVK